MEYRKYLKKAEFEKSLNTLMGIIDGIQSDQRINKFEIEELQNWCILQQEHIKKFPYKEIIPKIVTSIEDGILTDDEIEDIKWACSLYSNDNPYFSTITSDIQVLQGILHGILSDNHINVNELKYLRKWLHSNDQLETVYPYDEVFALLHNVLEDGKIDPEEEKILKVFFTDFIDTTNSFNINKGEIDQIKQEMKLSGICALGPNIEFEGKVFCFTGESSRLVRGEIVELVRSKGGLYNNNVIQTTDFLIVGDNGNPCWAFTCYGRKIEKAIELRKNGKNIIIAHEIDFWDALS